MYFCTCFYLLSAADEVNDVLCSVCCPACVTCQVEKEVKARPVQQQVYVASQTVVVQQPAVVVQQPY